MSSYKLVNLSVCLSFVCNVRAFYTQAIDIFGNISMPFGTLAISDDIHVKFYGDRSRRTLPSVGGLKRKRGSRI